MKDPIKKEESITVIDKPDSTIPAAFAPDDALSPVRLVLFIAGSTPRSQRAQENLASALQELGDRARFLQVEIVDVFKDPRRAIKQRVIVTPTLSSDANPEAPLIGDLSDMATLRMMLEQSIRNKQPS
jgi:circadian clock protein KaiB